MLEVVAALSRSPHLGHGAQAAPASSITAIAALRPLRAITEPAGMGGRPAQVQPLDRRPVVEAAIPHLLRKRLALEDVTPGEADAPLDVGRPQHLEVLDAVVDIGGVGGDGVEDPLPHLHPPRLPVAFRELVGRVLREDAHRVAPRRRHRGVVGALEVELREADRGLPAPAGVGGFLSGVQPRRDRDHRPVRLLASRRGERRQRVEPGVQLHHRRLRPPALDPLPIGGRRGVVAQHRESSLRVGVGDHDRGADQLTAFDLDPLAGEDPRHRHAGGKRGAALLRRLGDRERDPPHAALDIAPHRPTPQEIALVVHQPAPRPCRGRGARRRRRSRPGRRARA